MKTPFLLILAATAVFIVTVNSCTKTITQTKEVDSTFRDTIYDTAHDTAHDTAGPALLRFLDMFPDSVALNNMQLSTTSDGSNIVFHVTNAETPYYLPVSPTTPLIYYLFIPNRSTCFDSIPIPALGPNSIITYGIFESAVVNGNGHVIYTRANDSAKATPPPAGYCYLRFANGVPDYPTPAPQVYLYLDSSLTSVFRSASNDVPYPYTGISPYALVPSGRHTVLLRDSPLGNIVYLHSNTIFQEGSYYTAHITGSQKDGNVIFNIDQE